jgi:hypothetical protein
MDDIRAFFEGLVAMRFELSWRRDQWRHTCGGDAEEETVGHRANDNNKWTL